MRWVARRLVAGVLISLGIWLPYAGSWILFAGDGPPLEASGSALVSAPRDPGGETASQGKVELLPCELSELDEPALCGTLTVPENRDIAGGRTLDLTLAVLPATGTPTLPDPIVIFQGGPGQSAIEKASFYAQFLAPAREGRDLLLLDQRGTGRSNPLAFRPRGGELFDAPDEYLPLSWVRGARDHHEGQSDLTRYTSVDAVVDLEQLRKALDLDRINFYATSYGSRPALLYMQSWPDRVRSAVIKSGIPLSGVIGSAYAVDAQRSLELLVDSCADDAACSEAHPRIADLFAEALSRLAGEPRELQVPDSATGELHDVAFSSKTLALVLRTLLYSPASRAQVPGLIEAAARGELEPWGDLFARMRSGLAEQLYIGVTAAVLSAEDCPRLAAAASTVPTENTFLGDLFVRHLDELCAAWPRRALPADTWAARKVDVPTLVVSGRLDPAVPPRWGEAVAETLPNSLHVVYPEAGHPAFNYNGLSEMLADFYGRGSVEGLDTSAVLDNRPVPFVR